MVNMNSNSHRTVGYILAVHSSFINILTLRKESCAKSLLRAITLEHVLSFKKNLLVRARGPVRTLTCSPLYLYFYSSSTRLHCFFTIPFGSGHYRLKVFFFLEVVRYDFPRHRRRSAGRISAETGWFCERKHCLAGSMNSKMSGQPAGC
jgi:hypothetical protein